MTFITNDCLAYFLYNKAGDSYQSPFIGSLFEDDAQYVKFCKHFDEYIRMEPVFGEPKLPLAIRTYKNAPTTFLGDIEIHWPHEKGGKEKLLEKYQRRLERISDPIFIWSDMQTYNEGHSLKEEFMQIPGSLFIHKDDIELHRDKLMEDRNPGGVSGGVVSKFQVLKWLDFNIMASHVLERVGRKANPTVMSFNEDNT